MIHRSHFGLGRVAASVALLLGAIVLGVTGTYSAIDTLVMAVGFTWVLTRLWPPRVTDEAEQDES